MRYEIVKGQTASGWDWWTVVAYDENATCVGGDKHWMSEELAQRAQTVYEQGLIPHGDAADLVQRAWTERVR